MRKPNPRVGQQIAFRIRMKKRWQEDREGMLKRSKAGAKAMAELAELRKDRWRKALYPKPRRMTKTEIMETILITLPEGFTSKPRSVFLRLMRYGFIRFDIETMSYANLCSGN